MIYPPREAVYQQTQRWLKAGVFEALVGDLRVVRRVAQGRDGQPSAAILDSRTLQSSPESGARAGDGGTKRRRGSKVHSAVDTLGQLPAVRVTAANEQDRAQVKELAAQVQAVTGDTGEEAFVDQAYTGEQAAQDAAEQGIKVEVVKLPEAKKGFVLLPRRWVVERRFAWAARFRRLARDYERLPETLAGLLFLAFTKVFHGSGIYSRREQNNCNSRFQDSLIGSPLGTHTVKVEPCPTSLSTLIVPPKRSNRRFTI